MPTTINPSDQTITQYNVQTGAASNLLNNVAPGATSGVPLISQGSSSQPVFGTAVVAGGGTGVTTMTTAYAPICGGTTTTGALQVASTGLSTSGFALISNGTSALPSFQTLSAGGVGWVKITTVNASSSASLTITSGITSTYTNYALVYDDVTVSSDGNLEVQLSSDGGSSYKSTNYLAGFNRYAWNGGGSGNINSTSAFLIGQTANSSNYHTSGVIFLNNLTNTQYPVCFGVSTAFFPTNSCYTYNHQGGYSSTLLVNAIKILNSAGNMTTGDFTLYGIAI